MLGTLRKWIFGLIILAVAIFLGIMGFNAFLNYQTYTFKRDKEAERMKKQKEREDKEQLDVDIARMQKEALEGWSPKGKGEILRLENINHLGMLDNEEINCLRCNSCKNCEKGDECGEMQPKLIFSNRVNEYIRNVLANMIRFVNKKRGLSTEGLEDDNYGDNVSPYLKRYNAVLYGAPGTGKTELVNELVHHLFEKFNNPKIQSLRKEIIKLEKELELGKEKMKKLGQKTGDTLTDQEKQMEKVVKDKEAELDNKKDQLKKLEKANRIPPVFKIDGVKLQTGGETVGQPNPEEKLVRIIAMLKEEAFDGDVYSDEPYIVFVEEADQGKNVLTADKGKLLEEFKNFLSTSQDKAGLRAKAQDPNSIIIIATNNFADIDPAVFRRGRLGERLNFNWTPALLQSYGDRGDSEWDRVYWPKDDPGWQFVGNINYQDLYLLTSQFGYSVFADKFTTKTRARLNNSKIINKANQIIESYNKLSKKEKEIKEKELGYFVTGKKIKVRNEKTGEDEEQQEKICNWLLHFLFTFFDYYKRDDLDSFNDAAHIIPYDFGEAFNTQQTIRGVTGQLGEQVTIMNLTKNFIADLSGDIKSISKLMVETSSVQDQIREVGDKINEVIRDMGVNNENHSVELRILRNNVERLSNSSNASSSDISFLNNRISALENKVSGLGSISSSSGSSGGVPMNKINSLGNKINDLQDKLNDLISNVKSKNDLSYSLKELQKVLKELMDGYNAI